MGMGENDGMTGKREERVGVLLGGGAKGHDSERHPGIRPHQQERDLCGDTMTTGIYGGWI